MLLATDLDGTFLGGTPEQRTQLYELIMNNPGIMLVYVTGRGLESVKPLLADPLIPDPAYIICDVGATVLDGKTLQPLQPVQQQIEARWPGEDLVRGRVKQVFDLHEQPVPQTRRCAYFYDPRLDVARLKNEMDDIRCDLIISAGKFVDILPGGVNKGSSLVSLVGLLAAQPDQVLVAGDTMNDLSLYKTGYKGVVVGGAEKLLEEAVKNLENVIIAEATGAGGILEAMRLFPEFQQYAEQARIQVTGRVG